MAISIKIDLLIFQQGRKIVQEKDNAIASNSDKSYINCTKFAYCPSDLGAEFADKLKRNSGSWILDKLILFFLKQEDTINTCSL
ncbi:MAG: hypothetical protein D6732_18610 [Methanobacteriota archaeon]|nr:MAG: hypothetical protein D6732_18610 [Euryarchaeota archaeon]